MNASASRIARTLFLAALASAVAVGCSKKVKETPPTDTGPSTGTTTTPTTSSSRCSGTPSQLRAWLPYSWALPAATRSSITARSASRAWPVCRTYSVRPLLSLRGGRSLPVSSTE